MHHTGKTGFKSFLVKYNKKRMPAFLLKKTFIFIIFFLQIFKSDLHSSGDACNNMKILIML